MEEEEEEEGEEEEEEEVQRLVRAGGVWEAADSLTVLSRLGSGKFSEVGRVGGVCEWVGDRWQACHARVT